MTKQLFWSLALVASIFGLSSMALAQPTAPTASTTIVISQVYGGGGSTTAGSGATFLKDYVELKNISSTTQSLNGLSLYYGSATGQFASSAGNAFALPNVSLAPGQYFLVELGTVGTVGVAVSPTPDASTVNVSMSGTNGKVALVNGLAQNTCGATATPCTLPNAQIVDLVAWGTANNAEGGAAVAATSTSTAAVRKGSGCTDTDNNAADLDVLATPVPAHNMATTAAPCGSVTPAHVQHVVDFNGDGKTDYSIVRNTSGSLSWWNQLNNAAGTVSVTGFGGQFDFPEPADYDGDTKTDIAIWRPPLGGNRAAFWILNSSTGTIQVIQFGSAGDDPSVVGDYDGDGKADIAIFRGDTVSSTPATFWYRPTGGPSAGQDLAVQWGTQADFPVPGDYDGDGKYDFAAARSSASGQASVWILQSQTATPLVLSWGFYQDGHPETSDSYVPGDYDGDGKTDVAIVRSVSGSYQWWVRWSSDGSAHVATWGGGSDLTAQGDYDGDGKTDVAIYRPGSPATFWALGSQSGGPIVNSFGGTGDVPTANYNTH